LIEQLTELHSQLSMVALRILLPGLGFKGQIFPPEAPRHRSLLPELCLLLLQGGHLRLDMLARMCEFGDFGTNPLQLSREARQFLGHDRLAFYPFLLLGKTGDRRTSSAYSGIVRP
jgi:hypothetical protein